MKDDRGRKLAERDAASSKPVVLTKLIGGAVFFAVIAGSVAAGRIGPAGWWLALLVLVVLFGLAWWFFQWLERGQQAVRRATRRTGRCPQCGHDLRSLTPQPDGRRVCPDCGAAWRPHPQEGEPRPRICSCGYDLAGIPPSRGARVICPECGDSWRFE